MNFGFEEDWQFYRFVVNGGDKLVMDYFGTDVSGNETDGLKGIQKRINPKLITKNKSTEFEHVMDILIPGWRREHHEAGFFEIVGSVINSDEMCICTQRHIKELCYVKHNSLPFSLQIGNECIKKINNELYQEAKDRITQKKKEAKKLVTHRRCEDCTLPIIPKTDPSWKIRCLDCWKKMKNEKIDR